MGSGPVGPAAILMKRLDSARQWRGKGTLMLRAAIRETIDLFRSDRPATSFTIALLATNIAVVLASFVWDVLHHLGVSDSPLPDAYSIMVDGSYPEMLNYAQTGLCALFLFLVWRRTRVHVFLFWAVAFGFVLLDDALEYHETVGGALQQHLGAIPTLRARDTGETLAWLSAGILLAIPLFLALRQKASRTEPQGVLFLVLFGCLVLFAMGLDMLSIATGSKLVGYVEDGGEMLVLAAACSCAFVLFRACRLRGGNRALSEPGQPA